MTDLSPPERLPPWCDADELMGRVAARALLPRTRMLPAEVAEQCRFLSSGGIVGQWRNKTAPYMVEPSNDTARRDLEGVIFVGPARSSKTESLIFNPLLHRIIVDPGDTLICHMTEKDARLFSKREMQRFLDDNKEVRNRMSPHRSDDNMFDKVFDGMTLTIGYPVSSTFAAKDYMLIMATDYDRMPADIDGEGPAWPLMRKRTQLRGTRGMSVAESSPGGIVTDPDWRPSSPHEAPPTTGLLGIYNTGNRKRWYWPCWHCGEFFEAPFSALYWPKDDKGAPRGGIEEAAEQVTLPCPHCGVHNEESRKSAMNEAGVWLREYETITAKGERGGNPRQSRIASYWLRGPAAAFQSWGSLVRNYLQAEEARQLNGDSKLLRTVVNVDHGDPFVEPTPPGEEDPLDAKLLLGRKEAAWHLGTVPSGVRALVMTIDIQGRFFDCQVTGFGVGFEAWLVDRFQISQSAREGQTVQPGSYAEDWDLLWPLFDRRYPLADDPSRSMGLLTAGSDSGGVAGVTGNAYKFAAAARARSIGRDRFILLKGDANVGIRRLAMSKVDWTVNGRVLASGLSLLRISPDHMKDDVSAGLRRADPGPGYLHVPGDVVDDYFDQLVAERRDENGHWDKVVKSKPNEAFDHLCYARALVTRPPWRWDRIDWDAPQTWADVPERNANVGPTDRPAPAASPTITHIAPAAPLPSVPMAYAPAPPPASYQGECYL